MMMSATTPMNPPAMSNTKIHNPRWEAGAGSRPMGFSGEKSRAEARDGPAPAGAPGRYGAAGTCGTGEGRPGGPLMRLLLP